MGDYIRWAPPYYEGAEDSAKSALYLSLNRGKRSIRLNLKDQRGRDALLRLVREDDVLVEGNRPGVMDRLRLRHQRPAPGKPGPGFCAVPGHGPNGAPPRRPGHGKKHPGPVR